MPREGHHLRLDHAPHVAQAPNATEHAAPAPNDVSKLWQAVAAALPADAPPAGTGVIRGRITDASGTPNYRLTMPMPQVAVEDSTKLLAWTSRGDTLTIGGYLRYWNDQPATSRPEVRQMEVLAATADRVLFLDVLVDKAKEQGLERDSVVVAGLDRFHEQMAIDHYYLDEVWRQVDMSPQKLEAYFAARPGHYDDPESLKPRMILVDTKSLADSLRARLDAGDSFSDLASKFSMDGESAEKGGQIGLVTRGSNVA